MNIAALILLILSGAGLYTVVKPKKSEAVAYPVDFGEPVTGWDLPDINEVLGVFNMGELSDSGGFLPRGIRNKNPGNIRYDGTKWQGLDNPPSDGAYCRFIDAKYGIRAMARVLASYRRRGIVTLRDIIQTWAPDFENPTESYIYAAAARSGINPDEPVTGDLVPVLIEAIIHHENGQQPYTMAEIRAGVALA